ncbi:MAG TPA: diaminopimelate epimerase [Nevskiaceae bacterium]|nr:diaminopimelate epimerase [Nevskiaceae bacterium]
MKLRFTKMQGTGNDFVVIDATRAPFVPEPALLARLTDRRYGVGCDQVLVVEAAGGADVDFDYRIFNADGSEVGQCGNGARALARFVADRGLSTQRRLTVRTRSARLQLERLDDGQVRVNLGAPRLAPEEIPLRLPAAPHYQLELPGEGRVAFAALSMGNPHAVLRVEDVDTAAVERIGRALQQHPAFPEQVNVGFLQVQNPRHGRLRVYERGAGETLACGSGACAAMVAGVLAGWFEPQVQLAMRGGALQLEWAGPGQPVWLTGPVETVFEGELEWPRP